MTRYTSVVVWCYETRTPNLLRSKSEERTGKRGKGIFWICDREEKRRWEESAHSLCLLYTGDYRTGVKVMWRIAQPQMVFVAKEACGEGRGAVEGGWKDD